MSGRRPVLAALVAAPIAIVGGPALAVTQIARAGGSATAGAAVIGDSPIGTVDDSGQVGRTYVFPASVAATMPPAPVPAASRHFSKDNGRFRSLCEIFVSLGG
ncbi:hypothetical protein [Nostocoides vanveenii]|jgi:hypothetical protein|uniref:Uncharacterized protein n=1 Tax=Nostocoides vanveenii TaxID=330835 RepID=A0ABP4WYH6_9MICO